MKRVIMLPLLCLAIGCGCVQSRQPIYTDADVVLDDSVPGIWHGTNRNGKPDKSIVRVFREGKGYAFVERDLPTQPFLLVKIGNHYFIDLVEVSSRPEPSDPLANDHQFCRVSRIGRTVRFRAMTTPALEVLKQNPGLVKHRIIRQKSFGSTFEIAELIDSPKRVQRFILTALEEDPRTFSEPRDSEFDLAADDDKVTPEGMTSRRQRTFEYWYEMSFILASLGAESEHQNTPWVDRVRLLTQSLRKLPTTRVDTEARDCSKAVQDMLEEIAADHDQYAGSEKVVESFLCGLFCDKLWRGSRALTQVLQERFKITVDRVRNARATLSAKYGMEFPGLK
jgi:hypothetical protein